MKTALMRLCVWRLFLSGHGFSRTIRQLPDPM
jgi:hypothetical protein